MRMSGKLCMLKILISGVADFLIMKLMHGRVVANGTPTDKESK